MNEHKIRPRRHDIMAKPFIQPLVTNLTFQIDKLSRPQQRARLTSSSQSGFGRRHGVLHVAVFLLSYHLFFA